MAAHEAEIYAAVDAAKEAVHLHRLLQDIGERTTAAQASANGWATTNRRLQLNKTSPTAPKGSISTGALITSDIFATQRS